MRKPRSTGIRSSGLVRIVAPAKLGERRVRPVQRGVDRRLRPDVGELEHDLLGAAALVEVVVDDRDLAQPARRALSRSRGRAVRRRERCDRGPRCRPSGRVPPRRLTSLPASPGQEHDRVENDPQVEPRRPVRDVEVVDLDHLRERHARGAQRLPATGDSGRQMQAAAVEARTWRSSSITSGRGPTMLMLPPSTLKSCGSSSRPRPAQPAPDARDPRIVVDLEEPVARLVARRAGRP